MSLMLLKLVCNHQRLYSTASLCILLQEIAAPFDVFEEGHQFRRAPPLVRVEKMFEEIQSKLPGAPQFLLCLLPERKNCDIYG